MVQENGISIEADHEAAGVEAASPWPWGYLVPMAGVRYYMFLDGPEEAAPPVPAPPVSAEQTRLEAGVGGEV